MNNSIATYRHTLEARMRAILEDLTTVKDWHDFARRFLLGEGKSPNTTRSYLGACRQYFDFHGGAHPVETGTPEHIEQFYDSLIAKGLDLDTARLRIAGLRFMYRKLADRLPFFDDPFLIMPENLKAKLNRSKRDESERDAMTETEIRAVYRMLREDRSPRGLTDYALFRLGVTSGMRAAELAGLRWENVVEHEGSYRATFAGKGSKVRTIVLETAAVEACRKAYRANTSRKPTGSDRVLVAEATGRGRGDRMTTATIGKRISAIAERAKAARILRANLHFSPHSMRHTCATRLVGAGVPIDQVQRHLGHASLSTTAIYLHSAADLAPVFAAMAGAAA